MPHVLHLTFRPTFPSLSALPGDMWGWKLRSLFWRLFYILYFFNIPCSVLFNTFVFFFTESKSLIFIPTSASTAVFLSGGNVMVRGTAGMAQTSHPPARLAIAGSDSFSAMTETALVRTSFATATRTVMMAQTKTPCCVVGCVLLPVSF